MFCNVIPNRQIEKFTKIAQELQNNTTIKKVDLSNNNFGDQIENEYIFLVDFTL